MTANNIFTEANQMEYMVALHIPNPGPLLER